ncbi:hypothetical protein BC629DRAFT_1441919 [Irpex lacteus]|nr:hypothetical protein BC629DRAFT_1441919 [Irpex lacteus]
MAPLARYLHKVSKGIKITKPLSNDTRNKSAHGGLKKKLATLLGLRSTVLVPRTNDVAGPHLLALPNEILAIILTYLSDIAPLFLSRYEPILSSYGFGVRDERVRRLGWVTTAHVCTRLRAVALGAPMLWTSIVLADDSPRWLTEVLHRSGDQPLSLCLHKAMDEDREKTCAILSEPCHLSRAKSVTVADMRGWHLFACTLLTQPAPQLEDLFLGPKDPNTGAYLSGSNVCVLPSTLFGTKPSPAPRLRRLSLTQCDFRWSSLRRFSTITVLSIDRFFVRPDQAYHVHYLLHAPNSETRLTTPIHLGDTFDFMSSMKDVVTCLCALPCLEELSLENALPRRDPRSESDIELPRISLPKLRSIVIKQRSLYLTSLVLHLLDAPKLDYCELSYWTTPEPVGNPLHDQGAMAILTSFLFNFVSNLPGPIHTLELNFGRQVGAKTPYFGPQDATLSASCLKEYGSLHERDCLRITMSMAISTGIPILFPFRHTCIEPIVSALPLSNLNRLYIADSTSPNDDDVVFHWVNFSFWRRIYECCASATNVTAKGLALVPLIPLLATRNLPSWTFLKPPPEPRTPVFPSLKDLRLITEAFDVADRGVMAHIIAQYFAVVRDALESRTAGWEFGALTLPKLESLSLNVQLWGMICVKEEDEAGRYKETYEEMFAEVAEVVRPLELHVRKHIAKLRPTARTR